MLDKKTRPKKKTPDKPRKPLKAKSGFKRKTPDRKGRVRDINEDIEPVSEPAQDPVAKVKDSDAPKPATPEEVAARRAAMRLISGGEE